MAEKEYVERKVVLMLCQDYIDSHEDGSWRWVNAVTDKDIMNIPSADVAPVKHGHWIPQFVSKRGLSDHFMCSECAESTFTPRKFEMIKYAYCPNCGAKLC